MQRIHGIADPNSVQLLADEWAKRNFVDPAFIKSILESGQSSLSPFELQAVFRCFNGSDLSIQSIRDSADRDEPAGLTALSMLEGDMELADPPYTRIRPEAFHRMRNELAVEPDRVSTGLRPEGYPYYVPGRTYSYDIDWVRSTLQDSSESFARLKSERKNDTAVLVGNGPSLNLTDLSLLNGQDVFISNYAIKHPILSEVAKGVAVSNYLVAEQEPHQFQLSPIGAKFFPFWLRNTIVPDDRTIFLNAEGGSLYFSKDVTKRLSWKSTVSYFWLQILYSLGYQKIVMIGFDHSYQQSQTAKEGDVLDQKEDDQNHFDAGYFKGKKWQAADVSNMGETYEISRQFYELDGREIVNCTVGGALEVFRRADLGDELNAGAKISVKSLATTPKIALITPFWSGDVDGAERHWRILNRLGTPSGDHIHLYKHSAELLPPTTLPNVVFADIDTNFPEQAKQPHPSGPNLVFAHTVKMLADSGYTHFFWLEPDCVPTKPDWLEPFADAAAAHPDAPIIGVGGGTTSPDAPHWRHHFAGCSLYNIEQLNKIDWDDFIANDLDVSFDVWLSAKLGYIQVLGEDDGDNQGTIIFGASRHHWRLLERPDPVVTGMFEHWRPEKFLSKTQLQAFVDSGNFGMFHAIKDPQLQNHIYRSTKRSASTIIINYNNELYLKEAIDSALQQEDLGQTSYEVIVVDDGSSDSSTSIIAAYGDRIRPVYLEHGQLNGNFNQQRALLKALEIATGDVILLLDGDDTFSDRKVSTVLSAFDDATAVLVQHPLDMVNIAGEALGQSSKSFSRIGRQHTPELYTDTRQTNYFQPTSGLAFRRSYLRAISRFLKPDQFHRTWLDVRCTRPAVFYGKVITLGDSLGQWRRHEESDSIGTDNLWLRMVEHHDWFNQSGLPMTQPTLYIGGDHETKLRTTTRFCALDENNNLRFTADKRVVLAGGSEPIAVDVSGFNRSRIALCIPADSPDLSGVLESNLVDVVIDANYITAMLSKKTETGYDFKLAAKYVFVTFSSGTLDQKTRTSIQAACSGKVFFVHVDDHKNQVLQSVCEELTEALGYGPRFSAANPKDVDDLKKAISLVPELCFVSAEAKRLAPMFLAGQAGTRHAPSPPSVKPRSSRALTAAEQSEYDTVTASLPIQGDIFLPTDKIPPQDRLAGVKKIRALYDGQLDSIYRPRLRALKDRFVNRKRCFIIGNGPSLSHTDLDQLKDEVTFATNGFFLKAEELGWAPTLYIVEDHLVAEDRAAEIHELKAWTKLFPANLSYIIEPDDNTIFFDHRPRPSFPHGFDFSFDADVNTFAGGTVVYTCMQLAAYLGFEEIYLVGVDADYSIPEDAKYSGNGRVKELDMDSDDTNHFHPDYFGKGKRWHEPNVDVMLGAYKEAKQQCFARGVIIKNATLGGKLEVFPRADFSSLFRDVPKFPKLLIIDPTRLGDGTATGQLKESLMQEWAPENLMQVYNAGKRHVGVASYRGDEVFRPTLIRGLGELLKRTQKFSPEIVLYRPVPESPDLHRAAMHLIEKLDIPLATWIVDDWPTAIETGNKSLKRFDAQVRRLLKTSAARLSISPSMSHAFEARYGVQFVDIANGVDPDDWPIPELTRPTGPIKVRYAGSLATNMSLASVLLIAKAVESLSTDGIDITFEIKTRAIWHDRAAHEFSDFKRTTLLLPDGEIEDYRAWLSGADIVTIAYNFDDRSKSYIKYSQANKLPECLASGAALLAVGPEDVATMSLLQKLDCSTLVTQESCKVVGNALRELSASPEARHQLATKAQNVAFERFDLTQAQDKFSNILRAAAGMEEPNTVPRSKHAQVDETAVVAELLKERKGRDKIMLDVGAHFGTSAAYFHQLGWSIHCFEPDSKNRERLNARFGKSPNITIDTRAVSDKPAKSVSFYTSPESTGISGLHAFRNTHTKSDTVDVTTVEEIIASRQLSTVDFLKIDVEGFDFAVLKGVPWNRIKPDVVECEYEDAKTVKMGHTWKDVAEFLREKGYAVYLSEWHPIVRYGVAHDWRRIVKFPGVELPSDSWGNILAFREDPGLEVVSAAFDKKMTFRSVSNSSHLSAKNTKANSEIQESRANMLQKTNRTPFPAQKPAVAAPAPSTAYVAFAQSLHRVSPRLYGGLRFARRILGHVWTRKLWTLPLISVFAAAFLSTFLPQAAPYRAWLWVSLAGVGLAASVLYVAFRSYTHATALHLEVQALRREATQLREQTATGQILFSKSSRAATADFFNRAVQPHVKTYFEPFTNGVSTQKQHIKFLNEAVERQRNSLAGLSDSIEPLAKRLDQTDAMITAHGERLDQTDAIVTAHGERLEKVDSKTESHAQRLEQASGKFDTLQKQIEQAGQSAELARANLEILDNQISPLDSRVDMMNEVVKAAENKAAQAEKWSQFSNATWYQHFNRRLSADHINLLETEWRKRLSVPISRATLGYMANRACETENQLDGRLATSIEDILLRTLVARAVKGQQIDVLEIGTLFGVGAAVMFDALANHYERIHFTLLDPLEGYYNSSQSDILTGQPINERTLRRNLKRAGMSEDQFTLIKNLSTELEAIEAASARQYDVLVIDADHSYAGVKTDFENYAQYVKLGGYIIFDDYSSPDWPDVQAYVDSELADVDYISLVGSAWRTCVYRVVKAPSSARKSAAKPRTRKVAADQKANPPLAE